MSNSVFALQVSPEHPTPSAAARGPGEELLVQLEPRARPIVPQARSRSLAQGRRQPAAVPALHRPKHSRSRRRPIPSSSTSIDAIVATFDDYLGGKPTPRRARAGRSHRLLLRRVRLARELPDLLGRLGGPGRRSLQDGQRPEPAVRRGRASCTGTAISISASTATASRSPIIRRSIRAARRCRSRCSRDGSELRVTCPALDRTSRCASGRRRSAA